MTSPITARSMMIDLSIVFIFLIYYVFSNRYSNLLNENVSIQSRQIYTTIGILFSLCAINLDWIFRALTGDEVAYALQSQGQSYVIVRKALAFFPQLGNFPFRVLIQISSGVLLGSLFLALRLMWKIKSTRNFVLLCFFGTALLRFATLSQGGYDGPNPPGASFFYLVGSTILSPTNVSYRILSLLFASLFLTILYDYLKKIAWLQEYMRILILAFIISLPIFRHMSLIVEISVWAFYFASIILLQLFRSGGIVSYQQMFLGAIATTFRFPLIGILVPMIGANIFGTMRKRKNGDEDATYWPSFLAVLLCVPGILLVSSTKLADRFAGAGLAKQTFSSQFAEVSKATHDILSTFVTTTNVVAWSLAVIGILLFVKQSIASSMFLLAYFVLEFLLYFVFNAGELAYASKYIIEWFAPIVVLGLITFVTRVSMNSKLNLMFAVVMIILVSSNLVEYNRIPAKFVESAPAFRLGTVDDLGGIYRAVASIPLPYGEAFRELRTRGDYSRCLDVGIVYGVYPQIMAGYSGTAVLASLDLDHKYLAAQEQFHENWLSSSAKSIGISGSRCVIVGFVDGQTTIVKDLIANKWRIQNTFTDKTYQTHVFILTR